MSSVFQVFVALFAVTAITLQPVSANEGKGTIGVIGLVCVDLKGQTHTWESESRAAFESCMDDVIQSWESRRREELERARACANEITSIGHESAEDPDLIRGFKSYQRALTRAQKRR